MRFFSLFLGLCLILPNVSMAACGTKHVSYQGSQDPDDDEYVYQFWGTYQNAKNFFNFERNQIIQIVLQTVETGLKQSITAIMKSQKKL